MCSQHESTTERENWEAETGVDNSFPDDAHDEIHLLNPELPLSDSSSKGLRHLVVSMCVLLLLILEVSQCTIRLPLQQVLKGRL